MKYSIDFRKKVLEVKKSEGLSVRQTASRFHLSTQTVHRWMQTIVAKPMGPKKPHKLDWHALKQAAEQQNDAHLLELAERFGVSINAVFYALKKMNLHRKKNVGTSQS